MDWGLPVDEYVEDAITKTREYVLGVNDGTIIACEDVKLAVKLYEEPGDEYEFRQEAVEKVFAFFSILPSKKPSGGYRQFELQPFQAFFLSAIFGWYRKNDDPDVNLRKYTRSLLFIPRKNGKTYFVAAIMLYMMIFDGQDSPQVLLVASRREQAKIAIGALQNLIMHSPTLRVWTTKDPKIKTKLKRILNYNGNKIEYEKYDSNFALEDAGWCETQPSRPDKLDGYEACGIICDEVHTYQNRKLYDVLEEGTRSRQNYLILMISSAGYELAGFLVEEIGNLKKVLRGEIDDDSVFPLLYAPDEGEDKYEFNLESNWYKANPGLGTIKLLDNFKKTVEEVKNYPSKKHSFLTKDLNLFIGSEGQWIFDEYLLPVFNQNANEILERFKGKDCWLGLDLSKNTDLSALDQLFYDEIEDKFYAVSYFFISSYKEALAKNVNLQKWIDEGFIIQNEGETIDFNGIVNKIKDIQDNYNVKGIGYDRYGFQEVKENLKKLGFTDDKKAIDKVLHLQVQKPWATNDGLKEIEKRIIDKTIELTKNPVMLWNFRNIRLQRDGNDNIKIDKNKSKDATDGAVALNNAVSLYLHLKYNVKKPIYGYKL